MQALLALGQEEALYDSYFTKSITKSNKAFSLLRYKIEHFKHSFSQQPQTNRNTQHLIDTGTK